MGAERGNGYLDHLLKTPGLMRLGCQLVSEGFWKHGALALLVSGRAHSVSSHHGFLFLFFWPCTHRALGFEWRWHRLVSGSRRGSSWDPQDSGFSLHGVAKAHLRGLGFVFHSSQSYQGYESFWPLGDTGEPIRSGLWGPRG